MTQAGVVGLKELGLPAELVDGLQSKRALYGCVDWSERRDHFAGPLAVALLDAFIDRGWLRRDEASRALTVTASGKAVLIPSLAAR
ncbi:hypothetical protein [Herbaspirillum sp. NPDC101396]|uniref:hypothetical protein n=1 Tax=Herbaspirillum sp. NPDC101396 TaxID=3364005 RepID=UPI00383B5255